MRILFLTHGFNSLSQRLFAELTARGHEVSIEYDINDAVAIEAVALYRPDLIVAPYLRRAIPAAIWERHVCLVVHPGIVGDRGPSALDWAIQEGEAYWGVTVLQANAVMDGGDVWAAEVFPLRRAQKGSIYRHEVTEAATRAVLAAVARFPDFRAGRWQPRPLDPADPAVRGRARPLLRQGERAIDWDRDDTATVLAKIHAADGFPGVADHLFGVPCHLFDACAESTPRGGTPGELLGRRETAVLRATRDGAVWLGHAKRGAAGDSLAGGAAADAHPFKLPTTLAFPEALALRELPLPGATGVDGWFRAPGATWQDIAYEESDGVGFLHFDFYNGAMGARQCQRLLAAYRWAQARPTRVIVLMGGTDFWSNGIHLNLIEAAEVSGSTPADASWANINAIDDLAQAIIETPQQLTVAALQGNCGAGGCFLARAADVVWARDGVILNPHYKNMGNLFGSEYWTYLLPARVGTEGARAIMQNRLPLTARHAREIDFIDLCLAGEPQAFRVDVARRARELAQVPDLTERLAAKRTRRTADEAVKPLAAYRAAELAEMQRNFYGFDPSYHVARYHFVLKSPASWTPRHLARHRDLGWVVPA